MAAELDPTEGWTYPETLPATYQGFLLESEKRWDGILYRIFSYRDDACRRIASAVYDKSTQEYMLRLRIGLTEFCDVQFIHSGREQFESALASALMPRLETLQLCIPAKMETLFRNKKILEWASEFDFPSRINGFELFLKPQTCIQFTNGSYLILDYSDFGMESSLRLFYNVFRDDFFAEYLVLGAPQATQRFDVKTLTELSDKLKNELEPASQELRRRIQETSASRGISFAQND